MSNTAALYIVATPIGNLEDLSPRAARILSSVNLIAAEDTRTSRKLLVHFGIGTPMISLHEHNEREQLSGLLARLQQGQSIALISDAGTPLISDPGYHLVRAARGRHRRRAGAGAVRRDHRALRRRLAFRPVCLRGVSAGEIRRAPRLLRAPRGRTAYADFL